MPLVDRVLDARFNDSTKQGVDRLYQLTEVEPAATTVGGDSWWVVDSGCGRRCCR